MGEAEKNVSSNEDHAEPAAGKKWINRIIGIIGFLFLAFLIFKMVANKMS
jgi:hypothetical protein